MDLNGLSVHWHLAAAVSLREKGVDLNIRRAQNAFQDKVSLREKGVDLNTYVENDIYEYICLPS